MQNLKNIILNKLYQITWFVFTTLVLLAVAGSTIFVFAAFTEPTTGPAASIQDFAENILGANNADNAFDSSSVVYNTDGSIIERIAYIQEDMAGNVPGYYPGRGWVASTTGDNATTSLTQATCVSASGWEWFEDGNGDGDTTDPEDGICVATSTVTAVSWNGDDCASDIDNTYIAAYECEGSFPNGTVQAGTYSGTSSACVTDDVWNDGDCALCQADCYDGRKDLPDQGTYTTPDTTTGTGYYGPITPEVLKNWKGTRLPTFKDFFGYCGHKSGTADDATGDSYYYASGATSDKTLGYNGQNVGRGPGEYMNLSRTSYEWLSEQVFFNIARFAGSDACSYSGVNGVGSGSRFHAVFRP